MDIIDKLLELFDFLSAIREGFHDAVFTVRIGPA